MRVKLHEPTFGEEEIAAATEVLRSTNVTSGNKVREFERAFTRDHGVLCNSGSSANLLAVAALANPMAPPIWRLHPGDEVIVSALSWSTTVWPLVQHGLVPVIVDIDPGTLNIDVDAAREAIGRRTRAIMPVHVYGNPCDMSGIAALVDSRELVLIEDCCEALGATWCGEPVGSFGQAGTFSFYFSHHMTTLEGGMCVTRESDLEDLMRILRAHGWTRESVYADTYETEYPDIDPRFLFVNAGYNLRATELQAAIGLVQLPKLRHFVEKRQRAADTLKAAFDCYSQFVRTQHEEPGGRSSWFGFPVIVKDDAPFTAKELRQHFEAHGIETRSIICGNIARQPGMKLWPHRVVGDLKHADKVMRDGFSIGCHQGMGEAECEYVKETLDDFMACHAR